MRKKNEDFVEIMQYMIKIHHKYPELRFMQILGNTSGAIDQYYIEDTTLLELLKEDYEKS